MGECTRRGVPELADRAQHLGAFCRYSTSLPPALSELAILVVARHWRSQFEWYAHEKIARKAGVAEAAFPLMKRGCRPRELEGVLQPGESVVALETALEPSSGQERVRTDRGWASLENRLGDQLQRRRP